MNFWANLHVVVTGASSGIGEAIARELAAQGAELTLVARRKDRLEALAASLKGAHVVVADLSDPAQVTSWLPGAEAALGPVDVLVNNAGVELIAPTDQSDLPAALRLLQLDLHAPLVLTRTLLPSMTARGRGTIVDISSVAALAPPRGYFWYSAAKGGLAAASESLRDEIAPTGVHVVTVYPGPIRTAMDTSARAALEETYFTRTAPTGEADVLARLVRRAVERKRARVIYPRFFAISWWFQGLARFVADLTAPRPKRR